MANRVLPPDDWQVNSGSIQERAGHLLDSQLWVDCTFVFPTDSEADAVGPKNTLKAHKLILAMSSPVFSAMFYGGVGDKECPIIIEDIEQSTFSKLLEYIYTDEFSIPSEEAAMSIYKAANKYILIPLQKGCIKSLIEDLNTDNVCQIYEFACFFGEKELEEKCLEIFSTKTQSVLKSSSFLNAEASTLQKIVSMDTLDINSELDLFNALVAYVDNFEKEINDNVAAESNKDNIVEQTEQKVYGKIDLASLSSSIKSEEKRQILKGVIEKIRFLSIHPADLSHFVCGSAILSEKEKHSLIANLFFDDGRVPMPDGFSCIREPRIRGSATFRHTVHKIINMTIGDRTVSQTYYIRNLPWKVVIARESKYDYDSCMIIYLETNVDDIPNISKNWSCKVVGELALVPNQPDYDCPPLDFENTFCKTKTSFEISYVDWWGLINPKNQLLKNESFTIEMHLTVQPMQGADFEH